LPLVLLLVLLLVTAVVVLQRQSKEVEALVLVLAPRLPSVTALLVQRLLSLPLLAVIPLCTQRHQCRSH
jgi:hypothetical protein